MKKFFLIMCLALALTGCAATQNNVDGINYDPLDNGKGSGTVGTQGTIVKTGSMELQYATQYSVDYYEEGYIHIHIADGTDYVMIPENKEDNNLGLEAPVFIHEPCDHIYLAASSAMDLFLQLDSLKNIAACSTQSKDYAMEEVREAIDSGDIIYVGKYNAPDYEALLRNKCDVAIESTMIGHTPKTKEQIEALGIPVFVERSSYESDPLGRLEWIKLYGVMLGKEAEATAYFDGEIDRLNNLGVFDENGSGTACEDKTVAFFSVSSSGYVTVRKPGDYICKMIEMAGGQYALDNLLVEEDNALSTINIGMEDFYREAVNADILIYNGSIDGGINSLEELYSKSVLFKDFKAVKNGNVWSTGLNMFQESSKTVDVIIDMSNAIGGSGELHYLKHLE